jgi:hypothetical protein
MPIAIATTVATATTTIATAIAVPNEAMATREAAVVEAALVPIRIPIRILRLLFCLLGIARRHRSNPKRSQQTGICRASVIPVGNSYFQ